MESEPARLPELALQFLSEMFPGDISVGVAPFHELQFDIRAELGAITKFVVPLLAEYAGDFEPVDEINTKIQKLRRRDPASTDQFIVSALQLYFTQPAVVAAVRSGAAILFPLGAQMPEIDYSLLEPVFRRGSGGDSE